MADEVHQWSDELARDPSSLVFLPLAEALRRQGQPAIAQKVALRGLQRHPHNAEAHDLLARILADLGDLQGAFDEWDMVLRLSPTHAGALKGMAFVRFQQGYPEEAEQLLVQAQSHDDDETIASAIATVRKSGALGPGMVLIDPFSQPRHLYGDLLSPEQAAMCLDKDGLVLAGAYYAGDGQDVAQEIGAALSGVSDEAVRATRHLDIGAWRSIVFETEAAVVALMPAPASATSEGGLVVVAAVPDTPLGLLRRVAERCTTRTAAWLGKGAG
jgi:tetratricopeptide (TPR) repeat protein